MFVNFNLNDFLISVDVLYIPFTKLYFVYHILVYLLNFLTCFFKIKSNFFSNFVFSFKHKTKFFFSNGFFPNVLYRFLMSKKKIMHLIGMFSFFFSKK